jgi:hypothetical protein
MNKVTKATLGGIAVVGILYLTFLGVAQAGPDSHEVDCHPLKWKISGKVHAGPGSNPNIDVPLRCTNSEVICYIYHGYPSCFKR